MGQIYYFSQFLVLFLYDRAGKYGQRTTRTNLSFETQKRKYLISFMSPPANSVLKQGREVVMDYIIPGKIRL